jgi:hypothetical protein
MRAFGRALGQAAAGVAMLSGCQACSHPLRASRLIDAYSTGVCVIPKRGIGAEPSRQWHATLRLGDGKTVVVSAFQAPSGAVRLHYSDPGDDVVAADAGDYVYPGDIRWDPAKGLLYVEAQGARPVPWDRGETDLFEFDLQTRRHGRQEIVDPAVLPPECEAKE